MKEELWGVLEWRRRNKHCLQQQAKNFKLAENKQWARKEEKKTREILNNNIMFIFNTHTEQQENIHSGNNW